MLDYELHLLTWSGKLISELMITEGNKRERQDHHNPAFLPALQLLGPTELHYGYFDFGSPDGNCWVAPPSFF
jgi:hypothetical protein